MSFEPLTVVGFAVHGSVQAEYLHARAKLLAVSR